MQEDVFEFKFSEVDVYMINYALQQLPYSQVSQLIPKFQSQVELQKDKFSKEDSTE